MVEPVIIGNATLYLARCEDVLPQLGDGLDVVMDPPYLFNASGGGKFRAARKCLDDIEAAGLDEGFDVGLITKRQFRSVTTFCHNDQLHLLTAHLFEVFGRYVVCTWCKTNPIPVANKHLMPDVEPFVATWAEDSDPFVRSWREGGHPHGPLKAKSRFWVGKNGQQDTYDHPTVKPIDLMRRIIKTTPGDVVTDLFMGTGTTGAAALIEGRSFIGVEKDPAYFAMAVDRIRKVYRDGLAKMPGGVAA